MRPYQKLTTQTCYLCQRFLSDRNSSHLCSLCSSQRRFVSCGTKTAVESKRRPKFTPLNTHYDHPYQQTIPQMSQPINWIQQSLYYNVPIIQNQPYMMLPKTNPETNYQQTILYNLHEKGDLVGNIHTVEMKYCTTQGMMVDWILPIENNHFKEKSSAIVQKIENILLPWSILPLKLSNLPVNIQMQTTTQYIPTGSTFKVFCESFDAINLTPTFRMANKSSPVLKLQPYIQKNLTFSNFIPIRSKEIKKNRPRFLIIIDFEASCDFAPNPLISRETSEIIEFPWIVIDTVTLDIIYKRQIYIRPENLNGITHYCSQLTGITKDHCKSGISLSDALNEFHSYLKENILPYGDDNFCILTDGVWDLEIQLQLEAKRKGIKLHDYFLNYFDVRQEFSTFYSWFNFPPSSPTLQSMLDGKYLFFS